MQGIFSKGRKEKIERKKCLPEAPIRFGLISLRLLFLLTVLQDAIKPKSLVELSDLNLIQSAPLLEYCMLGNDEPQNFPSLADCPDSPSLTCNMVRKKSQANQDTPLCKNSFYKKH